MILQVLARDTCDHHDAGRAAAAVFVFPGWPWHTFRMRERSTVRLFLYLAYLGVLFVTGGLLYQRVAEFEGLIYLAQGAPEQVVVRLAGEGRSFFGSHRNMPLDVVPFRNPRAARRAFDAGAPYDAQFLPFRLRLDEIKVLETFPPRDALRVESAGVEETRVLEVGGRVDIGGHVFEVVAIRPWSGLFRNAKGSPMASVSLSGETGGWPREVLLQADSWVMPQPGAALHLRWFGDQAEAEAAASEPPAALAHGRWGVADGPAVHWATAFAPGTGFTLRDGTEATLTAHETDPPAIVVEFRKGDTAGMERLEANAGESGSRLRYEHPGLADTAYVLHAWRDAAALVTAYHRGKRVGSLVMEEGDTWAPSDALTALRLEQVMQSALPVTPDMYGDGVVHEAVLRGGGEDLQLREGARERWNGIGLMYHRETPPPRIRLAVTVVREGEKPRKAVLAPGETFRAGDWVFSQDPAFSGAAGGARLVARRTMGGPAKLTGMAMVVAGAAGWVLVRFRNAPPKSPGGAGGWQDVVGGDLPPGADSGPPPPGDDHPH